MLDTNEPINQHINETEPVREFTGNNSNKKKIGIAIVIAVIIFIISGEFAISHFIQGQSSTSQVKIFDNSRSLIENMINRGKSSDSVTSGIVSTLIPTPTIISATPVAKAQGSTPVPASVSTLAPTSAPASAITPTPTVVPTPIVATPKIDSLSPLSGPAGQEIVIKGYNFGSSADYVMFCLQGNCSIGAAPIVSWSDIEIKARVPGTFTQTTSYELYVNNKNGKSSNRVTFTITAGQPVINNISPSGVSPGGGITLSGSNFGSSGQVNFYKSYPTFSGSGNITSWSNTQINFTIPTSFEGSTEYGIQVINDGGAQSSFKYYTLGANPSSGLPIVNSLEVNGYSLYLSTSLTCTPASTRKIAAGIWDFGDGATHTFQIIDEHYSSSPGRKENINTGHSYVSSGTYTVTGKCKDDLGNLSASVSKSITVSN